jgi:prepilin-type N-terminal cleavage/methylation domain-containing protein
MKSYNRTRGFTLIEILVALAIIVFGFTAVMRLVSSGYEFTVSGNQRAKANRLLQELIEEAMFVPIAEYTRFYGTNLGVSWIDLVDRFYPKAHKSLNEFRSANEKSWKEFAFEAQVKARKNELGQVVLLSLVAKIQWREQGRIGNQASPLREITAGTIVSNPEAGIGVPP